MCIRDRNNAVEKMQPHDEIEIDSNENVYPDTSDGSTNFFGEIDDLSQCHTENLLDENMGYRLCDKNMSFEEFLATYN